MILALTAAGACRYIHLFTRFSGELFGALIAVSPAEHDERVQSQACAEHYEVS